MGFALLNGAISAKEVRATDGRVTGWTVHADAGMTGTAIVTTVKPNGRIKTVNVNLSQLTRDGAYDATFNLVNADRYYDTDADQEVGFSWSRG